MAKKAAKKKEQTPAPVYVEVATLTIRNYTGLPLEQQGELQDWLRRRIAELQGQSTAISKVYTAHYKIPKPVKA